MKKSNQNNNLIIKNDDDDEDDDYDRKKLSSKIKSSSNSSITSLPSNPSGTFKFTNEKPKSPYSAFTHHIRKIIPEEMACSLGCGGQKCKYCNSNWPNEDMALDGVFSHWITDDILAMARPTTRAIREKKLIENMKKLNIKSIFNLEMMNEHKSCGDPLEPSGFSYDPNEFLKNEIYYYNFGFQDYSTVDMLKMIDMVKVFSFAVKIGRVAVHCHAGLGRTGLFIACYLIYSFRMNANATIHYIRDKRNKSVQMNEQIEAIQKFENFLNPLRIIFADNFDDRLFTLNSFIVRQRYFLHGFESRDLRYIPKIIFTCIKRLRKLLENKNSEANLTYESNDEFDETAAYVNRIVKNAQKQLSYKIEIANALASQAFNKKVIESIKNHQNNLNSEDNTYDKLMKEKNPNVLVGLMWSWLEHLQVPALREQEILLLENDSNNFDKLDKCTYQTLDCILEIYRDLNKQDINEDIENEIIFNLISILTHTKISRNFNKNSQLSINTLNDNYESNDNEKLINFTNKLKKQHLRTIYNFIQILIKNVSKNGSQIYKSNNSSADDDEELRLMRDFESKNKYL